MDIGALNGNGEGLNLSKDMVIMFVIADRAGKWDSIEDDKNEEAIYYEEETPIEAEQNINKTSNGFLGILNATGYNLSFESTNKTPKHSAYGITASGFNLRGHTRESAMVVATDQSIIPFGTKLLVFNNGYEHLNGVYTL